MAKNYNIMEQLKENVTCTAANAYTEVELTLLEEIGKRNKKGDKIKVMMVYGIGLEIVSGLDAAGATDQDEWLIQFTTNSEAAEVEISDKDLFFKYKEKRNFVTGGHLNDKNVTPIHWFPQPLPYIKKRMWVAADSTGLAAALDINFTIYHGYGYVSQFTLNRMIAKKI